MTIAATTASRHQARTSSTAALASARAPTVVVIIRCSDSILASTGNAVTDIAAPMNSANAVNEMWCPLIVECRW